MKLSLKRVLVGRPLETHQLKHQRLNNFMALAVFSSDALSSVAYATEEIVLVLAVAGTAALTTFTMPIAIAICILFTIVILSYRQTIPAYPSGGGAYIVAKDNLGTFPGLVAAGALLTDYILTVAVSTAAGVAAITSAAPSLFPYRVVICLACVAFITLMNLRGVRESGAVFSVPTYFFLGIMAVTIIYGMFRALYLHQHVDNPAYFALPLPQPLTVLLILRAFSSGCAALTGIEAISNGIPAFKPPEAINARKTLTAMAFLCIIMFFTVTYLAYHFHVLPDPRETVVSQIARHIFGRSVLYYCLQVGTALILIMAANTSFADFPRLSSILARANFMPRQMANLGDRLVFANGIILLGTISCVLLIAFNGITTRLIPLYAVGVFLSFTLSQSGMVIHWLRLKTKGWWRSIIFNALGALATAIVVIVSAYSKFMLGAWIVIALIPIIVYMFHRIANHYKQVAVSLRVETGTADYSPLKNRVFLPISGVSKVSLYALRFCYAISDNVTGLYININQDEAEKVQAQIDRLKLPIPFIILDSPFRSITKSLIEFVDRESKANPDEIITLVIPEFMPRKKWQYLLHNQTAMGIFAALRGRENVVITSVRKRLTV
jgi:amino acid transporter